MWDAWELVGRVSWIIRERHDDPDCVSGDDDSNQNPEGEYDEWISVHLP